MSNLALKKRIELLERKCCCNTSDCCYEEITLVQAQELVASSALVPNTLYKITGVHKNKVDITIPVLYDDGTNSGISIYLLSLTPNTFSKEGWGEFYNPKYDKTGYGNPDPDSNSGYYTYNIWNGDDPDEIPTYAIGRKIIWGGYVWVNVGLDGDGVTQDNGGPLDSTTLNTTWEKVPYNTTDYTLVIDEIEYDFQNDWISRRRDSSPVIDVVFPYQFWNSSLNPDPSITKHAISVMQWGNKFTSGSELGVGLMSLNDAIHDCVNFRGKYMLGYNMTNYSWTSGCTWLVDCEFLDVSFTNHSYQKNLKFQAGSTMKYCTFDNRAYQEGLTLYNTSYSDITYVNSWESAVEYGNMLNCTIASIGLYRGSYFSDLDLTNVFISGVTLEDDAYFAGVIGANGSLTQIKMNYSILQGTFSDCSLSQVDLSNGSHCYFYGTSSFNSTFKIDGSSGKLKYRIYKSFDGTSGNGAVGDIKIGYYHVPENYFIDSVEVTQINISGGAGSNITLGILTDDEDSGLTSVTGLVSTLSANKVTRYSSLPFTSSAGSDRYIVAEVGTSAITSGIVYFDITLNYIV